VPSWAQLGGKGAGEGKGKGESRPKGAGNSRRAMEAARRAGRKLIYSVGPRGPRAPSLSHETRPRGPETRPVGSQGDPKHTTTLACHGGAPIEIGGRAQIA